MFCMNCGTQLPDGAKFCFSCGCNLGAVETSKPQEPTMIMPRATQEKPMKALICELCGGNRLVKENGYFICENCGTKYSLEEAKKMMIEGTVQVTGTVKVDDSDKIKNYYMMAQNALKVKNFREAEDYANRIIEAYPNNEKGWYMKGSAALWQSSFGKTRIEEGIECWHHTVEILGNENDREVKDAIKREFVSFIYSYAKSYADVYGADTYSDVNAMWGLLKVLDYVILMQKKVNVTFDKFEMESIYQAITQPTIGVWKRRFLNNPSPALAKSSVYIRDIFHYFAMFQPRMNNAMTMVDYKVTIVEGVIETAKTAFNDAENRYGKRPNERTTDKYLVWIENMRNISIVFENCGEVAPTKQTVHHSFSPAMFIQKKILGSYSYKLLNGKYVVDAKPSREVVVEAQQRYKTYKKRDSEYAARCPM